MGKSFSKVKGKLLKGVCISLKGNSTSATTSREKLLAGIKGSKVVIPNLKPVFGHWPQATNPEIEKLDEYIQGTLESLLSGPGDKKQLQRMKKTNVAQFGATWWPFASLEPLKIDTHFATWLFLWDDETDSQEFSSLINDFEKASAFRKETAEYLKATLSRNCPSDLSHLSTHRMITFFKPIGDAFTKASNDRQLKSFLDELIFFVDMCEEEHRAQQSPELPTIDQYMRRRMGSGAVRTCLALIEYSYGISLPEEVMESKLMQSIWYEANVIICVTNDMMSIKKEVEQSQTDSLIPLLYLELGSVQQAMNRATDMIKAAISNLDNAEKALLAQYSSDPSLQEDIRKFTEGVKYACTSNLNWGLTSGRYKLGVQSMEGGVKLSL
ncbi:isoprenoid synthase domain-containing protein [Biscogniauxia sp. FL1348]|nr:isoprenoid synthase domain-containing protein [Biscogniauxia sp. FL1348]